jgi:MFS family permease
MAAATTPIPKTVPLTIRQVLADQQFFRLWLGQFVSITGDFVAAFAIQTSIVFRMHGAARDAAGLSLAFLLPPVLIGPLAGVFVDRWNPRRTMIASDLSRGVLVLLLAFATNLLQIYLVCLALSCVSSFFLPAQSVTLPLIVKREGLLAASAVMQQTVQTARIVSPFLASALAGWLSVKACYYADALTFFFSAAMLAQLAYQRPVATEALSAGALASDLQSGIRFVLKHREFSFVIGSMAGCTFALGCFGALISVYVRDVLRSGAYLLGTVGSLMAVGTIAGASVAGSLARKCANYAGGYLVSGGLLGIGICIFALAALRSRSATLVCAAGMGVFVALVMVASAAMLQGQTPPELRGRVNSSSTALIAIAQIAAMGLAGAFAARIGIIALYYASAALLSLTAVGGIWWLRKHADEKTGT